MSLLNSRISFLKINWILILPSAPPSPPLHPHWPTATRPLRFMYFHDDCNGQLSASQTWLERRRRSKEEEEEEEVKNEKHWCIQSELDIDSLQTPWKPNSCIRAWNVIASFAAVFFPLSKPLYRRAVRTKLWNGVLSVKISYLFSHTDMSACHSSLANPPQTPPPGLSFPPLSVPKSLAEEMVRGRIWAPTACDCRLLR